MIALRDFLRGTGETASRKIPLEVFSRDAESCEGEEVREIRRKTGVGRHEGGRRETVRDTRRAKSIARNFPSLAHHRQRPLFILSTVHLTLKCADDFPLFPAHFALALLLRAFSLSRLFGNLFFSLPGGRRGAAALFVTVNHRYPSASTFFLVIHNRIFTLVLVLVRLNYCFPKKIFILYKGEGQEKEKKRIRDQRGFQYVILFDFRKFAEFLLRKDIRRPHELAEIVKIISIVIIIIIT